MSKPVHVEIPHSLGRAAARTRIEQGLGRLPDKIPGGAADIRSSWTGDRMNLVVTALGQTADADIDVFDDKVVCDIRLPALLALFAGRIEEALREKGPKLLR